MSGSSAAPDLGSVYEAAGQRFNVDPALLRAISGAESGGNFDTPDSSAGAMGGMQVMPQTYATVKQRYGLGDDPRDPTNNIMAGAAVLSENLSRYGNVPDALRAYNGGTDPTKWSNPQTAAYPSRVAQFYQPDATSSQSSPPAVPSSSGSYDVASADTGTQSDAWGSPAAPPASAVGKSAAAASMSDDDLHALLTGSQAANLPRGSAQPTTGPASLAGPSQAGSGALSDDQLHSMLTGGASAPPPSPAGAAPAGASSGSTPAVEPPAAGTAPAPSTPSDPVSGIVGAVDRAVPFLGSLDASAQPVGKALVAGGTTALEGAANTVNRVGAYADESVPALANVDRAALPAIGVPQPAQGSQAMDADIAARDQQYAGSPAYLAGKIGGDLAITAPVLAAGGAVVDAGLEAAPAVSNALSAGGDVVRSLPGGSRLASFGSNAIGGAATGATAAAAASGQSQAPLGQQLAEGAATGGLVGGALAPMATAVGRGIRSALSAGSVSPEIAALANTARTTYGIPLTAAQITQSRRSNTWPVRSKMCRWRVVAPTTPRLKPGSTPPFPGRSARTRARSRRRSCRPPSRGSGLCSIVWRPPARSRPTTAL